MSSRAPPTGWGGGRATPAARPGLPPTPPQPPPRPRACAPPPARRPHAHCPRRAWRRPEPVEQAHVATSPPWRPERSPARPPCSTRLPGADRGVLLGDLVERPGAGEGAGQLLHRGRDLVEVVRPLVERLAVLPDQLGWPQRVAPGQPPCP